MSPYRILIVEDQREVSRLLRSALETLERDLIVLELPSAEEAILESTRNKVDLLVADYRLPGMTGIELLQKVRKNRPQAKIILITGQTDPRIRKNIAEAGADAFFIKPVPIADFLDAVERHLGLVETILPPEPIAVEEEEIHPTLPDLLASLRQGLEANAVFLMNDTGRILAQAGNVTDLGDEIALVSSLLSLYSAGDKVAHIIGQATHSNWHVFTGGEYDLFFSPVGKNHAMVVIGKGLGDEQQLVTTVNAFSSVRKDIETQLDVKIPVELASAEPTETLLESTDQSEKELEPLFKGTKKKLKPSDVNEFWNNAANPQAAPTKPDMLSYEQAKKLGLTPQDES